MQVHNHHGSGLTLPHGQAIPAGGSVDVDAEQWTAAKKHPVVGHWLASGMLKTGAENAPKADEGDAKKKAAA